MLSKEKFRTWNLLKKKSVCKKKTVMRTRKGRRREKKKLKHLHQQSNSFSFPFLVLGTLLHVVSTFLSDIYTHPSAPMCSIEHIYQTSREKVFNTSDQDAAKPLLLFTSHAGIYHHIVHTSSMASYSFMPLLDFELADDGTCWKENLLENYHTTYTGASRIFDERERERCM